MKNMMRAHFFKKWLVFVLVVVLLSSIGIETRAEELIETDIVPEEMQPETVITFCDESHYVINKGGIVKQKTELVLPIEIQKKIENAKKDGSYDTAYHAEKLKPVKGLKVIYADDGFILRMEYPEGVYNPLTKAENSPNENIDSEKMREGPGPNDKLLYTWGAHENQIWQIGNTSGRYGYGRATNFTDTIGERDNRLVKGDCATNMKYDDCPYGTKLSVNGPKKGGGIAFVTLTKRDKGSLPDAVLDIWKTGVEYFGYTWSSSVSINDIQYTH